MKLYEIVLNNNIDEVKKALSDCDINEQEETTGFTALHYCAQNQYVDIAKLLIDKGADVNIQDKYGNTPLFKAVFFSEGKTEMIKLLVENGADPDVKNKSDVSPRELAESIGSFDVTSCFEA